MSSDPTRPMPQWWQQPQGPQDPQDPQDPRPSDDRPGSPSGPGHQDSPGYQGHQGNQGYQGYRANPGYQRPQETQVPLDQGSQETQMYPTNQAYQSYQPPPPQEFPSYQGYQGGQGTQGVQGSPPPYRRRRRRKWPWITLIVIVVLLVAADRGANAFAEDQMASQFQKSVGLSGKPHVTIEGIPFLTQLAAQKFNKVDITATNETITAKSAGSGLLEIASLTATLQGMHIHGANSATIDQFTASALITFSALGSVGGIPQGITLSADGPNQIKAIINVDPLGSFTAHGKITRVGPNKINIKITDFGGIPDPGDALGNLTNFNITLPKLPAGVTIQNISVTQQGLRIIATGQNTTLSQ
jgi:hypothetical protein